MQTLMVLQYNNSTGFIAPRGAISINACTLSSVRLPIHDPGEKLTVYSMSFKLHYRSTVKALYRKPWPGRETTHRHSDADLNIRLQNRSYLWSRERHGEPPGLQQRGYRPLSTAVWEEALVSDALKSLVMNGCGNARIRCWWWNWRSDGDAADGLVILSTSHSTALSSKP